MYGRQQSSKTVQVESNSGSQQCDGSRQRAFSPHRNLPSHQLCDPHWSTVSSDPSGQSWYPSHLNRSFIHTVSLEWHLNHPGSQVLEPTVNVTVLGLILGTLSIFFSALHVYGPLSRVLMLSMTNDVLPFCKVMLVCLPWEWGKYQTRVYWSMNWFPVNSQVNLSLWSGGQDRYPGVKLAKCPG